MLMFAGALLPVGCHSARHASADPPTATAPARPQVSAASSGWTRRWTRWSRPTRAPRCWRKGTSGPRDRCGRAARCCSPTSPTTSSGAGTRAKASREFLRPSGYTGSVPRGGEPGSNGLAVDGAGPPVPVPARRSPDRAPGGATARRSRPSPTSSTASASTAPTTWSCARTATSTSPIRSTASRGTRRIRSARSRGAASTACAPAAASTCSTRR